MVVLAIGATEEIGQQIVAKLLEHNYQVRALVKNATEAKSILGDRLDFWEADLAMVETLLPAIQGVSTVICCTKTKIEILPGNRVELDSDLAIESLIDLAGQSLSPATSKLIFDFTHPNIEIKNTWGAIDDVVMGGVSQSNIFMAENKAIFSGIVSTDNNGGFASVRTRNFPTPLDLSNYEGIELRVIGDGKRYKFIARCEGQWDGVGYCYSFDTVYDFPIAVRIPFKDLIPVFRAKTVREAGQIDSSKIYSLQLMLSKFEYDGGLNPKFEPGSFTLKVESIQVYGGKVKPQFINVNSLEFPSESKISAIPQLKEEESIKASNLNYTTILFGTFPEELRNKISSTQQEPKGKEPMDLDGIAELCIQTMNSSEAVNKTLVVFKATN